MIVLVDNKRPTGIGESLSGAKAFFINASQISDWHNIEENPEYQHLDTDEQLSVKVNFPLSVQRFKAIWSTHFY